MIKYTPARLVLLLILAIALLGFFVYEDTTVYPVSGYKIIDTRNP